MVSKNNLMVNKPKLSKDEVGILILLAAILFGGIFRLLPAWLAGFPVNDGGMFYAMMKDLQANHYAPPLFATYNNTAIPFAYPPLGFYAGAGLSDLLNVSLIAVLQWLPAIVHTVCIPALYFLARELTGSKITSAVTAFAFALTPHLNTWLSVGGGLTRSFGTLFLVLTILFSHRLFIKNNTRDIGWTILFGSLTVLSHTESVVFAIGIPIYIWLAKSRTLKSALQGGWVALGVLLLAGPWYGLVISRHGIETLLSALQTGGQTIWAVLRLINIDLVTEEPYLDLLGVFGILGMATLLARRQYFLPLMFALMYLIQPRSAHTVGNVPLAIAAGVFTVEVLLPAISKLDETNHTRGLTVLSAVLMPYLLVNSIYQAFMLSQNHVSEGGQAAMQWVRENTPADSQFLVLTGEPEAMCDSSGEWFPTLAERTSLSTLQGREWLLGNKFGEFLGHRAALQNCINEGLECLNRESEYFGDDFDYIYIAVNTPTHACAIKDSAGKTTRGLAIALDNSLRYSIAYQSKTVAIFEKIR
jgi:asparagine N-glycosylation enzyme membrane subunit Stt3